MKDLIHIFIQENRDAFDAAVPGAHGWTSLERMLERLPCSDALERHLMCDRMLLDTSTPSEKVWTRIETSLDQTLDTKALEWFIRQNRDAFDTAMPQVGAWEHIVQSLPKRKAIKVHMGWQQYFTRIAAALALLVAGVGAGIWYERLSDTKTGMAMSDVSQEYREIEQFYQRDISVKIKELASFTGSQTADVGADLKQLDEIMEQLRQELASVPPGNREQVVRAMINNYKAKTAILQRVLERLEDSKYGGDNRKQGNEIKNM